MNRKYAPFVEAILLLACVIVACFKVAEIEVWFGAFVMALLCDILNIPNVTEPRFTKTLRKGLTVALVTEGGLIITFFSLAAIDMAVKSHMDSTNFDLRMDFIFKLIMAMMVVTTMIFASFAKSIIRLGLRLTRYLDSRNENRKEKAPRKRGLRSFGLLLTTVEF